ncbi:efflux RND transporter periplasmic adaptor subunit [uncultured Microbulbifer sp.]|uniref:efflux RND transporter periplasmic adaptor subunit n=1 Tax=uncultured Microbulbifer sp. TaxID=348147 RepID=UPI002635355A|nr:efflux RND transporter periplasmic adaptor subunit [uncultured Microbulbifer sp.]
MKNTRIHFLSALCLLFSSVLFTSVLFTSVLFTSVLWGNSSWASEGDHHHEEEGDHHEENIVELSDETLARSGIKLATVQAREIERVVTLYGKLQPEPTAISHIRARYPGLVSDVAVSIGDRVKKGQTLASINSNESLQEYKLRAPFDGVVTEKHAGSGEFVSDQTLFTVADYRRLWADLQVFPQRLAQIRSGQSVEIVAGEQSFQGKLQNLVPGADGAPFQRARVPVDNQSGSWSSGIFVEGRVTVGTDPAGLAIDNRALQTLDGQAVVFVQTKPNHFAPHPVRLGRRGVAFSEVLEGMEQGERYVAENSYLLKAELKKSAAGHAH